jgi:hypothetical protein
MTSQTCSAASRKRRRSVKVDNSLRRMRKGRTDLVRLPLLLHTPRPVDLVEEKLHLIPLLRIPPRILNLDHILERPLPTRQRIGIRPPLEQQTNERESDGDMAAGGEGAIG